MHSRSSSKRKRVAHRCFQKIPAPQVFLTIMHSAYCDDIGCLLAVAAGQKRVSWTLSRKFWQQNYFRGKSIFARCALATVDFFQDFRNLIRSVLPAFEIPS